MKFFFDNNLSPHMARGMGEFSKLEPDVETVVHLSDLFKRDTNDVEWINKLSETGQWYILSSDRFKKQHDAEREALRRAGHTVFVFDAQWTKQTYWLQCERLIRWWPRIIAQSKLASKGGFRVPWKHTASSKFEAIRF